MQELLKHIRTFSNMSQAEFAEYLNVSFATVNRWENERAIPNKLAQSKIYDFCKKNGVFLLRAQENKRFFRMRGISRERLRRRIGFWGVERRRLWRGSAYGIMQGLVGCGGGEDVV